MAGPSRLTLDDALRLVVEDSDDDDDNLDLRMDASDIEVSQVIILPSSTFFGDFQSFSFLKDTTFTKQHPGFYLSIFLIGLFLENMRTILVLSSTKHPFIS